MKVINATFLKQRSVHRATRWVYSNFSSTSAKPKYEDSINAFEPPKNLKRQVIVVGGGHNGLITAAYLAKSGADVLVLERRHCVGGAAVTEEIVPGFKFSRASYLAGLLRPKIIEDLELEKYGFKYLVRNPSSFTPTPLDSEYKGKYLILGSDAKKNRESIAQFSEKDAQVYDDYEDFLGKVREIITPIVDAPPPDLLTGNWRHKLQTLSTIGDLIAVGAKNREVLIPFGEIMVGPAETILDRWFESDILKTTLATDAVIGAQTSPKNNGSAYVLMHHVMGEAAGVKGVWAYVEGGMGAISNAIAASAEHHGAEIITDATVREIMCEEGRALGVVMKDGTKIYADTIISGASPYHTFSELIPRETLTSSEQASFLKHVENTDMSCGAFKINLALKTLPEFACYPSPRNATGESIPGPMHMGTVHFEHSMKSIEEAYKEASMGKPATRPVIEMTIPSAVDSTVAPPGQHVAQLFIQYAPYEVDPATGSWDDESFKAAFADRCIAVIEEYCPGFTESIVGRDVLSPLDLERIFGLPKGNIHHGALGLHQLAYLRPVPGYSSHRTPVEGLYLCSAGTHPGGGVMGACGRNCAMVVKGDQGK